MAVTKQSRVRVGGSGFTIFTFGGQPIAFAQQISHTSPQPVGPGAVAIHPMDEPYPVQVITPAASGMGSLVLNMYELYQTKVWDRLGQQLGFGTSTAPLSGGSSNGAYSGTLSGGLFGAVDLVDVFIRIAESPDELNIVKYIRPPGVQGTNQAPYAEQYHGCVITNIEDGESIEVGTMEVVKRVTVGYTYQTRNGKKSKAWDYRDRPLR